MRMIIGAIAFQIIASGLFFFVNQNADRSIVIDSILDVVKPRKISSNVFYNTELQCNHFSSNINLEE